MGKIIFMMSKGIIKQFLKPSRGKILFSVLIFIMLEIVLYLMTQACAYSCPPPPTPCRSYCLLDSKKFLPASILAFLISYFISSIIHSEKRSIISLLLILLGITAVVFFVGFFVYPFFESIITCYFY